MKIQNIISKLGIIGLIVGGVYLYTIASTSDFDTRYGYDDTLLWSENLPIAIVISVVSLAVILAAKFIPIIINNIIAEKQMISELKQRQIEQRKLLREKHKTDIEEYTEFLKKYETGYRIDD